MNRRQFLNPRGRSSINSISTKPVEKLTEMLPYSTRTGFTPTSYFYTHAGHEVIKIEAADWRLSVGGLIDKPVSLSFDELQNMQAVEMPVTLASITSTPDNLLMGHALWKGVSFKSLLNQFGARAGAKYVQLIGGTHYKTYLSIHQLDKAILAYAMNGEPLPVEQGYPVRLIVPGVYDYKMPKWVTSIELVSAPSSGQYESRGWSADGIVQTTSAILTPRLREVVGGKVTFSGVAFAGMRTITRIELSIDDGEWMPVSFGAGTSGSWTRWQIDWMPPALGDYLVKVRATDSEGFTQPDCADLPIFPNGSSRIHAVVFRVSTSSEV